MTPNPSAVEWQYVEGCIDRALRLAHERAEPQHDSTARMSDCSVVVDVTRPNDMVMR